MGVRECVYPVFPGLTRSLDPEAGRGVRGDMGVFTPLSTCMSCQDLDETQRPPGRV